MAGKIERTLCSAIAAALLMVPAGAAIAAPPAKVPDNMVSASDPESLVRALKLIGAKPELTQEEGVDPDISFTINDYNASVIFYGCNDEHKECDSFQLAGSFTLDKKQKFDPKLATKFVEEHRYAAVFVNESGEPDLRWDMVTVEPMPVANFTASVVRFGEALEYFSGLLWPDTK